jgi:glycerophosphoryl diester phosphodiesterase
LSNDNPSIIWISHRGLCQNADENTQASFAAAVQARFHYLETDLRCTKDGHIVLSHDQTLNRTGDLSIDVSSSTRKALSDIKLSKGSHLLFLDDFMFEFGNLGHVFDIKPETGFEVIEQLCHFKIDLNKTFFLCWSKAQQKALLKALPGAKCFADEFQCKRAGFSTLLKLPFLGGICAGKVYAVPPSFKGLSLFKAKVFKPYYQRGAEVLAYLPETKEAAQMAIAAKVSYILCNHDFNLT